MTTDITSNTTQLDEGWRSYDAWNELLAGYFFGGRFKDRPVYLDVNDKLLDELGKGSGLQSKNYPESFKRSIRNTISQKSFFRLHQDRARLWRQGDQLSTPPFIGLLAFFSYVAEKMVMDEEYHVNNYYGRMLQELSLPSASSTGLQTSFRSISLSLWDWLNDWIDGWDGEIGLKTARALDSRWYVSTAISQALIRENDRNLLKKIFDESGLNPGQKITADQMLSILFAWANSSAHVNSALSKLLNGAEDLRDKVIEVACSELELWDGRLEVGDRHIERGRKLFCIANIRKSFPKYKLDILLCAYISQEECGGYRLLNSSSLDAKFAFEEVADDLRMDWSPEFEAGSLEPYESIGLGEVLRGSLRMCSEDAKVMLSRVGSPLCILNFRKEIGSFYESPRVALGQEALILAHNSIKEKIESALHDISRPGFIALTPEQVSGLPEGWVVYKDVQVVKTTEVPGIEALTPLVGTTLEFNGGLFLGHNTWLSSAPPEVLISYETDEELTVVVNLVSSLEEHEKPLEMKFEGGVRVINLAGIGLKDGNYQVSVFLASNKSSPVLFALFRLSSSSSIRLLRSTTPLAHYLREEEGLGFITASRSGEDLEKSVVVRGMHLEAYKGFEIDYLCFELEGAKGSLLRSELEEVKDRTFDTSAKVQKRDLALVESKYRGLSQLEKSNFNSDSWESGLDGNCISAGRHVVIFSPNSSGLSMGICRSCGLALWQKIRGKQNGSAPRVFQIRKIGINKSSLTYVAPKRKRNVTPTISPDMSEDNNEVLDEVAVDSKLIPPIVIKDIDEHKSIANLMDAICYLRQGTFENFSNLVRVSIGSDSWVPHELLRKLSALGHIDVQYDLDSMRPKSWRVVDPTLMSLDAGGFILCGWRSEKFISRLNLISSQLGGSLTLGETSDAIPVIRVEGLLSSEISTFADIVSEESDFPLLPSINFTEKLLTALPVLSQVKNKLPSIELPYEDMDYFDTSLGKWLKKQKPAKAGAYRLNKFGVHYFYLPQEYEKARDAFHADSRLVKYLACQSEFGRYYVYDEQERKLSVPLGMELPYLYERVAISCAGILPAKNKGYLTYSAIPPEVAEGLAYKLFSE
jgi:hypothetical protein